MQLCFSLMCMALIMAAPLLCASFSVTTTTTTTTRNRVTPFKSSSVTNVQDMSPGPSSMEDLNALKTDLVRCCTRDTKPTMEEVKSLVEDLEAAGEQLGIGQASSSSGLLSGEWQLLYSPEDVTRSSPFFWAFGKAFPDVSDQIFGITDAIPAPLKEVGPAFQEIRLDESGSGEFVSKVKVATLGGWATSIMTTRGTILGAVGYDGIRIRIDTTKPEESTAVQTLLGPSLGDAVNEKAPPFPSGQALERVAPGSSEVVMRTTYCDESLRISRNEDKLEEPYVWKRTEFASFDVV